MVCNYITDSCGLKVILAPSVGMLARSDTAVARWYDSIHVHGTDNTFAPFDTLPYTDPKYTHRPYIWGTPAEQYAYADTAMKLFRACGASGISWWQYQDIYYHQNPDSMTPGDYKEAFFGLLNPGRWNAATGFSAFRKPVVSLFQSFNPEDPPGPFPQQSNLYYNPYNFDSTDVNTISGTTNFNSISLPVSDGVVLIQSKIYRHPTLTDTAHTRPYSHYSFTKQDGSFHAYPAPDDQQPTTIDDLKISYPGCQRLERGWSSIFNPNALPIAQNGVYSIASSELVYDAEVTDTVIAGNVYADFRGWNSVTFTDAVVHAGGHGEAVARQEILLESEFDAVTGSEVYLHLEEVFPECTDFSGYLKPASITASSELGSKTEIELLFHPQNDPVKFELYPNPSSGMVIFRVTGSDMKLFTLSILDLFGRIKSESEINKPEITLDLSMLARGVYLARISNSYGQFVKKLIIK